MSRLATTSARMREAAAKFDVHEAAEIFPLMTGKPFEELVADIKANGLLEPIVRQRGLVLDGRNRFRACIVAGVRPKFEEYEGKDPLGFVLSLNLKRRHLDESQRAMAAARAKPLFAKEALERQRAAGGDRRSAKGKRSQVANVPPPNAGKARDQAGEALNVSGRLVSHAENVIAKGIPELVAAVERGELTTSAASGVAKLDARAQREVLTRSKGDARKVRVEVLSRKRAAKIAEIVKGEEKLAHAFNRPIRFGLVLADPPWRYDDATADPTRQIENQYPTMSLDEICALEVPALCMEDCVLALWTTSPKLAESMRVIDAWGFSYRTCAVWDKERVGMGYWFRQRHELLLLAVRGSPATPGPSDRPESVFRVSRSETHSEKPAVVAAALERMFPGLPKVELFARAPRDGWSVWGNQSGAKT